MRYKDGLMSRQETMRGDGARNCGDTGTCRVWWDLGKKSTKKKSCGWHIHLTDFVDKIRGADHRQKIDEQIDKAQQVVNQILSIGGNAEPES